MNRRQFIKSMAAIPFVGLVAKASPRGKLSPLSEGVTPPPDETGHCKAKFDPSKEYGWYEYVTEKQWNDQDYTEKVKTRGMAVMAYNIPEEYQAKVDIIVKPPDKTGSPFNTCGSYGWIYRPDAKIYGPTKWNITFDKVA